MEPFRVPTGPQVLPQSWALGAAKFLRRVPGVERYLAQH